jgi:membrane-bound ClpP family serine protease
MALGLVLLGLGACLLIAEAHVPSSGVFGVGGGVALIAGAVLVLEGIGAGLWLIVGVALVTAAAVLGLVVVALPYATATRRRRVRGGAEGIVGHFGVVRSAGRAGDRVLVDGALWAARSSGGEESLHEGDRVVVEGVRGLTLSVRKAEEWEVL